MVTKRFYDEVNLGKCLEVYDDFNGGIGMTFQHVDDDDKIQNELDISISLNDAKELIKELENLISKNYGA